MSLSVTVLCPNGRRKNIKVSPNTTILRTLEDFCDRENIDSSRLSFLFQRKILDETLSWRYANVPNNAKLELVPNDKKKTETPVRIALQYDVTERVQHSFPPSATLLEVLSHWRSNLSGKTPAGHEPSIVYMRQEICGLRHLAATTLKSLGLTGGSAALRLFYKPVSKIPDETSIERKPAAKFSDVNPIGRRSSVSRKVAPAHVTESKEGLITQQMLEHALSTALGPDAGPKPSDTDTDATEDYTLAASSSGELMETARSSQSSSLSDFLSTRTRDIAEFEGEFMPDESNETRGSRVRMREHSSSRYLPQKKFKPTPPQSPAQEEVMASFKFPEATQGMDLSDNLDTEDENLDIRPLMEPCSRESVYYDENEIEAPDQEEDPGDEFFELNVDDIRKMLADLRSIQRESEEKMLITARTREIERLRAINRYPRVVIRVVFPNRTILQGIFRPAEPLQKLYDFVRNHLRDPRLSFHLYTTPPRVVLKDLKSILYDNHLTPAAKVYFSLKDREFHPKMIADASIEGKGTTLQANDSLQSVFNLKPPSDRSAKSSINDDMKAEPPRRLQNRESNGEGPSTSQQAPSQTANSGGARSKVPKWFKIGRK